jgi:hypothetical protein
MGATDIGTVRAAPQHKRGTIAGEPFAPLWRDRPAWPSVAGPLRAMTAPKPEEFLIRGVTLSGHTFRPSDWAERLAGAMSCFRPEGAQGGIGAFIGYSPLCVPRVIGGVKCVIVSQALQAIEPMAWDFVMNFARDNELQLVRAGQPLDDTSPAR